MAIEYGVDTNGDGVICWDTLSTDNLNEIGSKASISDVTDYSLYWTRKMYTGDSEITYPNLYDQPHTDYGRMALRFGLTAVRVNNGFWLFRDATLGWQLPSTNTKTYNFRFMWRSDTIGQYCRWQLYSNSGTVSEQSQFLYSSSSWQAVTFTYTASGSSNIAFRFYDTAGGVGVNHYFSGIILTTGFGVVVPDGYNTGDANDYKDNITQFVDGSDTQFGNRSGSPMPDEGKAEIILLDDDEHFVPENSSGDYYQLLMPNRMVRVRDNTYTIPQGLFHGYIEDVKPTSMKYGERRTKIRLYDEVRKLKEAEVEADFATGLTVSAAMIAVLQAHISGWDVSNIETSVSTVPYFADNFSRGNQTTFVSIFEVLKKLVEREQGYFWIDGNGLPNFVNRYTYINSNEYGLLSFDDSVDNVVDFKYVSNAQRMRNYVVVTYYPRVEAGSTSELWKIDKDIIVPRGEKRKIKAPYRDANNQLVGAKTVATPSGADWVTSGGSPVLTFNAYGQEAKLEIDNTGGSSDTTISTANIKGYEVSTNNPAEAIVEDETSIGLYGKRVFVLDMPLLDDAEEAYQLASWILAELSSSVSADISQVLLHSINDGSDNADQLNNTVGTVCTVVGTRLHHDRKYVISKRRDKFDSSSKTHDTEFDVTYTRAESTWVLDVSKLDLNTRPAY